MNSQVYVTLLPAVTQVLMPVALLWWTLPRGPDPIAFPWLRFSTTTLYLAAIGTAGLWLATPTWLLAVYIVWLGIAAWRLARHRQHGLPPRRLMTAIVALVVLVPSLWVVAAALAGRRPPPGEVVDLAFPLHRGVYQVVNGGNHDLINAHLMTQSAPRFTEWRGQSLGVDIVRLGAPLIRLPGWAPVEPTAYAIFGVPVSAPCPGTVIHAEDGHPDMPVPDVDRAQLAGNHVILACGAMHVVLAHLQRDSVGVTAGETVAAGDVIGRVAQPRRIAAAGCLHRARHRSP